MRVLFLKCEGDECRAEFNTVNFFEKICDMECIELCGDLYNITKNDICVSALKRDEFAVAVAVAAICWYFYCYRRYRCGWHLLDRLCL